MSHAGLPGIRGPIMGYKLKNCKDLLTKFSKCPVCSMKIPATWFRFGADVGIVDDKIHLSQTSWDLRKHVEKYHIDINTSTSTYANPNAVPFDVYCFLCDKYSANFQLTFSKTSKVSVSITYEEIYFSRNGKTNKLLKQHSNNTVFLETPDDHGDTNKVKISNSFLKLMDYKDLEKRINSLLLFDK